MSGLVGDTADVDIPRMISQLGYITKYTHKKTFEKTCNSGNIGIGLAGRQDSSEHYLQEEQSKIGVIDGFVYTDDSRIDGNFYRKVIAGILLHPEHTLPELNGSFLIACTDGKKLIVATDRLATRPCFYSLCNGRLIFGSEIKTILPVLERKSIDAAAIGDLVAYDFMLGERTLINEIHSIQPSTFIKWENGKIQQKKYCGFNFTPVKSSPAYPVGLLKVYEKSVDNVLNTMGSQKIGIFLSGGLDSRLLFGILLKKNIDFSTITYDFNPPGGINPIISKRISEKFGIENVVADYPYYLGNAPDIIREAVWKTDGMTPWQFIFNIDFDLNHLHKYVDVVIANPRQGEFFGEDLSVNELKSRLSPVETLRKNMNFRNPVPEDVIEGLLHGKYCIKEEIQKEILKTGKNSNYEILLNVMLNNYYPNIYKGNITANLIDIKNIFSYVKLFDEIARLPMNLRKRELKFPKNIPLYPVSPLKLELIRLINRGLENVPYERTGALPGSGMYAHALGFMKKSIFRNKNIYSYENLMRETKLQKFIYKNIQLLCNRNLIDGDIAYGILDKHMNGKANFGRVLGSLTTASLFIEKALI